MKHLQARILISLSLTVLLLAGVATAQTQTRLIAAKIPFAFSIGDKSFPAGQYSLALQGSFLQLRDAQGRILTTTITNPTQARAIPKVAKLSFNTLNGRFVLANVWEQGDRSGYELDSPRPQAVPARKPAGNEGIVEGSQP